MLSELKKLLNVDYDDTRTGNLRLQCCPTKRGFQGRPHLIMWIICDEVVPKARPPDERVPLHGANARTIGFFVVICRTQKTTGGCCTSNLGMLSGMSKTF